MIKTARLTLRNFQPGDAKWITEAIANPNVHRWLSNPPYPYQLSHAVGYIDAVADDPTKLLIEENGQRLGGVTLSGDPALPSLGYWLDEAAWGRGVMTEAAEAVLDRFFKNGGGAIESSWIIGNSGSEGVLRKLGFQDNGPEETEYSEYYKRDMPVFPVKLTAAAWQARQPA